jgi:heme a synthase
VTDKIFTNMVRVATILAFIVVVLGAYVRLSDAGLGCPDWPGCYGRILVPQEDQDIARLYPNRPLEHTKAWKEMFHRYAAGLLGLVILFITALSWKYRNISGPNVFIPTLLLLLVIFQSLLGMWTVTLLLKPVVVMAHLLGGMTLLALLFWLLQEQVNDNSNVVDINSTRLFPWAIAGLCILTIQISLGGWTSANYAALACPDFPVCQGSWWPSMDFISGFTLWHGIGIDYEGGILDANARTAIHMMHRLGAVLALLVIGAVSIRAITDNNRGIMHLGIILLLLLLGQILLGIANVLLRLPLPVAVAHNGMAALLLLDLIALLHRSTRPRISRRIF